MPSRLLPAALRKFRRRAARRRNSVVRPAPLYFEPLEDRRLLAYNVLNIPFWLAQGPAPSQQGDVENILQNDAVSGAIAAIAPHPADPDILYVGTVGGGVWRTDNSTAADPADIVWSPLTDALPSLSISALAVNPLDPATVFAGTGALSTSGLGGPAIGILRSADGGATWTIVGNEPGPTGLADERVVSIVPTTVVTPDGQLVLAATMDAGGGVYASKDGGTTWTLISGTGGLPFGEASQLIADPGNPLRVWVTLAGRTRFGNAPNTLAGQAGIYAGAIDGAGNITWTKLTAGIPQLTLESAGRVVLSIGQAAGNPLVAAVVGPEGSDDLKGVFRSIDGGVTWRAIQNLEQVNTQQQGSLHLSLLADRTNDDVFFIGGDSFAGHGLIYRVVADDAVPANDAWTAVVDDVPLNQANNTAPHAGSREMVFTTDGRLLEASNGGLTRLVNPNSVLRVWRSHNGNLNTLEMTSIAFDPLNLVLFGSTINNGTTQQTDVGSLLWDQYLSGDGGGQQAVDTVTAPGQVVRYSLGEDFGDFRRRTFNVTPGNPNDLVLDEAVTLAGLSAADAAVVGPVDIPFALNTIDPRLMMLGFIDLYEDADPLGKAGDAITNITANLGVLQTVAGERISSIVYGGRRDGADQVNVAIVGTSHGRLFFRNEAGAAFTEVAVGNSGGIDAVVVDPQDWRRVWVLRGNEVFLTQDITTQPLVNITDNLGGLTSQVLSLALFDNTPAVAGDSMVVAGGYGGVYRRVEGLPGVDPMCPWVEYGQGMPNTLVSDVHYVAGLDLLVAATLGRGSWLLPGVSATIAAPGILQVVGDNNPNNMRLEPDPDNPLRIRVVDGVGAPITFESSLLSQVQFLGNDGNDVITLSGAASGTTLQFVHFAVEVQGGDGADQLILDNTIDTLGTTVTVSATHVGAAAGDTIFAPCGSVNYDSIAELSVQLGSGNDTVLVTGTSAVTNLWGNQGNDQFTVGDGDLTALAADVVVQANDGDDALHINDAGNAADADYCVETGVVRRVDMPGAIFFDAALEALTLDATDGANVFHVLPSTTTLYTIHGNLPPTPTVGGDFLGVDFTGTSGATLTNVNGNGSWQFDAPHLPIQFTSIEAFNYFGLLAVGADAHRNSQPLVKVYNAQTNDLLFQFLAYEANFRQGVRVAVGDVNGDGVPDIVTAPGRRREAEIRVFSGLDGTELPEFRLVAYNGRFRNGVTVAVGDVDGDGLADIITGPSRGRQPVQVFRNNLAGDPLNPLAGAPFRAFQPFHRRFRGGVNLAAGDLTGDGRAEIIVGSGAAMRATIRVFDAQLFGPLDAEPPFIREILPSSPRRRGGVTVAVADLAGSPDDTPEIIAGLGVGAGSRLEVFNSQTGTLLNNMVLFDGNGSNAPLRVAADVNGQDVNFYAAQGPDGRSQTIRHMQLNGLAVDNLLDADAAFQGGFWLGLASTPLVEVCP